MRLFRSKSAPSSVRPRPKWLRALGTSEPPAKIEVDNVTYAREEVLKHDSWAATGTYVSASGCRILCKFNRQSSIFGIPMRWLGRILGQREAFFLRELQSVRNVPQLLPPVHIDGQVAPHAVAREYLPGHPLGDREYVGDDFFAQLAEVLQQLHVRGIAYVDLHKRENVIVGDDGRPYLIDFQISQSTATRLPLVGHVSRAVLRMLQHCDRYHMQKLCHRSRPDRLKAMTGSSEVQRPWIINLHRCIGVPFRTMRRKLLVLLAVRGPQGRAETEVFAEDAFRTVEQPARAA
jgi:serine/threonine protein kinase